MAQHKASESALVATARALDRELDELARNADQLRRAPLTTQRQIERVRELLAGIAPAEEAVRARIAALERAVQATHVARAEQLAAVDARRAHIDARAAELQRLVELYIGLGMRVSEATEMRGGPADARNAAALEAIAGEAAALLSSAKSGDFPDIAALAETLGKQVATLAKRRSA